MVKIGLIFQPIKRFTKPVARKLGRALDVVDRFDRGSQKNNDVKKLARAIGLTQPNWPERIIYIVDDRKTTFQTIGLELAIGTSALQRIALPGVIAALAENPSTQNATAIGIQYAIWRAGEHFSKYLINKSVGGHVIKSPLLDFLIPFRVTARKVKAGLKNAHRS